MSASNAPVIDAIRNHHARLAGELHDLTSAVVAATASDGWRADLERLAEWYRTELVPHAVAEEAKLYALAAGEVSTRLLVRGMVDEHRQLVALVADLALSRTALQASTTATAAEQLFRSHLGKENDLLLPALDESGADLGAVLAGMHEILGRAAAAAEDSGGCGCGCGHDEPIQIGIAPPAPAQPPAPAATAAADGDLDVRTLPHGARHEIIFSRLNALGPGDELVIVNDHDPKPLRYQTAALWPDAFEWSYRETGPERWRVAIRRAG